jgi:PAS domain S-box-containing protein
MDRQKLPTQQRPPSPKSSPRTATKTQSRENVTIPGQGAEQSPWVPKTKRTSREKTPPLAATLVPILAHEMDELGHLMDALPDGVVITDERGYLQLINRQTEALFGWSRQALLGQSVEVLLPERFRRVHRVHRSSYAAKPHLRPMGSGLDLFGLRQDSTEFPVEISLSPISVGGKSLVLATIRDVTAQRRLEQHVRQELAVLQAVLDELPVGVYLARGWDAELVLANRHMVAIWRAVWQVGQSMSEFIAQTGSSVYDLQGRVLSSPHLATLRALRTNQSVCGHQEVIRHADGSTLSILVNAIALDPHIFPYMSDIDTRPDAPTPVVLVVHDDVSALMQAERLKDEFVALAAHELRNPVASLLGYSQMLIQATGPRQNSPTQPVDISKGVEAPNSAGVVGIPREWQEEAATAVMEAAKRLAALTDDLLDTTRLQANQLELRPEPLEIGALVRRVVKRQRLASEKHTITTALPPDTETLLVEADAQRLEQVLTNLLSNAIKYSPDGGNIEVEASRQVRTEPGSATKREWARVEVRDHGMGIPADQFDRIFVRFGRATNARERAVSGTGLGLYLCRELVERHGGQMWFESTEGVGTTFTFELPCWAASE